LPEASVGKKTITQTGGMEYLRTLVHHPSKCFDGI
jgi:hypothetical protein